MERLRFVRVDVLSQGTSVKMHCVVMTSCDRSQRTGKENLDVFDVNEKNGMKDEEEMAMRRLRSVTIQEYEYGLRTPFPQCPKLEHLIKTMRTRKR